MEKAARDAVDAAGDFRRVTDPAGREVTIEVVRAWEPLGFWDELSLVVIPFCWLVGKVRGRAGYAAIAHVPRWSMGMLPRVIERHDGMTLGAARRCAAEMANRFG